MIKLRIRKLLISQGLRWIRVVVDPRRDPTSNSNTPAHHWNCSSSTGSTSLVEPVLPTSVLIHWLRCDTRSTSLDLLTLSSQGVPQPPWCFHETLPPWVHCPRRKALPFLYDVWKAAPQPSLCQGKAWAAFLWRGLLIMPNNDLMAENHLIHNLSLQMFERLLESTYKCSFICSIKWFLWFPGFAWLAPSKKVGSEVYLISQKPNSWNLEHRLYMLILMVLPNS